MNTIVVKDELRKKTDELIEAISFDDVSQTLFNDCLKLFRESNLQKKEGHAGFGGGDSEYDYEEFIYAGLAWRFHFCNSGRKFVDVNGNIPSYKLP